VTGEPSSGDVAVGAEQAVLEQLGTADSDSDHEPPGVPVIARPLEAGTSTA
jgi:hypothetical protein